MRLRSALGCATLAIAAFASRGVTQEPALLRAMDLEQRGQLREAAAAYREALGTDAGSQALLGLERVFAELGWNDSILPVADSAARARPRDPLPRTMQLRALTTTGRRAEANAAFERWVRAAPRDAAPFREYARMLLSDGDAPAADTVLRRAQRELGTAREVAMEVAQLRAAMGMWGPSAESWREALGGARYLVDAAVFALQPAPPSARPAVRRALGAAPATAASRRTLAALELAWGSPGAAWIALSGLPPSDSSAEAWAEFADRAEGAEAWAAARDALAAALAWRPTPELAARAAGDALNAGDAAAALALLGTAAAQDSTSEARVLLPLRVRALSALGRTAEAERAVASFERWLDADQRARFARALAAGWVRAGDVPKARAALAAAGAADEDESLGWLALYDGDLGAARTMLRRSDAPSGELVLALALLARTRATRSPDAGDAFLALARGDTTRAAAKFAEAAASVPEAAPLLLGSAARLHAARRDEAAAIALWQSILARYADAPEAAEADLEWGRALRRRGQTGEAIARLEHLILTYPESALVPQARREIELARNAIPASS